jgi:5'-3' exonuclease
MKYALVDLANTYFRCRHIASRGSDSWEKVGMALHLTLNSVNSIVRMFGIDHVVFCLEGRSWRKDFYKPYKANRALDETAMTAAEIEENELFWNTYSELTQFLKDKTNASVLRDPQAEADDLIARFVSLHSSDTHYIISSDTDFVQLIAENVHQYNGITGHLIKLDGYWDERGRPVVDKKTKEQKQIGDPMYVLFEKCMRGDSTDNVFSAYPGVRSKGSKTKVGLLEAYADRDKQGFKWNNLMLQHWVDPDGVQHLVRDDYDRNRILIDLTAQPPAIKDQVDISIITGVRTEKTSNVGLNLMKFCGKYELTKISENVESYAKWLNSPYKGLLHGVSNET